MAWIWKILLGGGLIAVWLVIAYWMFKLNWEWRTKRQEKRRKPPLSILDPDSRK